MPKTQAMERIAERALNAARHRLLDSGNPAFVAVALPQDGPPRLAPLVVANHRAAEAGVRALRGDLGEIDVLVVGCARQGRHLRFTVQALEAPRPILDRLEVRERPIGEMGLL